MRISISLLQYTGLVVALPAQSAALLDLDPESLSLPEVSTTVGIRALQGADLRIASKQARYDNNKPHGQLETITLYIYNAGPDVAVNAIAETAYGTSMDGNAVTTTLRQATTWHQPSEDIKEGSLTWTDMPSPKSENKGYILTHLPDIKPGTLLELGLSFPMTHAWSYTDREKFARVLSSTPDPEAKSNMATYLITPNHHYGDAEYWKTPGDLAKLDSERLAAESPSQADLRIASARLRYNNDLPINQGETLEFLVYNHGPAVATKPTLKAGYTSSMIGEMITWGGDQVWVPEGVSPSSILQSHAWQALDGLGCGIDNNWQVICDLPDLPPRWLYRVRIYFPMNHVTTYRDFEATASISSETTQANAETQKTSYWITPNHDDSGDAYWNEPGNVAQLDGPSIPTQSRACSTGWLLDTPVMVSDPSCRGDISLSNLESWISSNFTKVIGYDIRQKALAPQFAAEVKYGQPSEVTVVSFSADNQHEQSYSAHPDTLVYLEPTTVKVGQEEVRLGYWIPVRMLWPGAALKGMRSGSAPTTAYVTRVETAKAAEHRSAQPLMVSQSHSYAVGTLGAGSILAHDQGDQQLCASAETSTIPSHLPRRDEEGNWLVYLHEDDNPAAVENARYAVGQAGRPWRLTYDPAGERQRLSQSMLSHPSQADFLQLSKSGGSGNSGIGQLDRDEYPPAIATESGSGTIVTYISPSSSRSPRSWMEQQFEDYRKNPQPDGHAPLKTGDGFRYAIIHANMVVIEHLGSDLLPGSQIEPPPTG